MQLHLPKCSANGPEEHTVALVKLIPSCAFLLTQIPRCFSSHSSALSNENPPCMSHKENCLVSSSQGILVNWSIAPTKLTHWIEGNAQGRSCYVDISHFLLVTSCTFMIWQDGQKGKEVQLTLRVFFLIQQLTKQNSRKEILPWQICTKYSICFTPGYMSFRINYKLPVKKKKAKLFF